MASRGDKEIKRDWPVVTGLDAAVPDKLEGRKISLVAQKSNLIPRRQLVGIDE